jgi:hypothetical protein
MVKRHPDLIVVTDEVYENILFDSRTHVRIASLPGMWDRALTVSSAGELVKGCVDIKAKARHRQNIFSYWMENRVGHRT